MNVLHKTIALVMSLVVSCSVYGQEWIEIARSESATFHIKSGSIRVATNDSFVKVVTAEGRITKSDYKKVDYLRWYIPINDCKNNSGRIFITEIDGTYRSNYPFTFDDGKIAGNIAQILCIFSVDLNKHKNV